MKNPSRSFYFFVVTLSLLLALAGAFLTGYYSGRNDSLAELWQDLSFGGALFTIFASVVYKKKGQPRKFALRRHV